MKISRLILPFLASISLLASNYIKTITARDAELIKNFLQTKTGGPLSPDIVAAITLLIQATPGAITRHDAAIVEIAENLQNPYLGMLERLQLEDLLNTLLSGAPMRRGPGFDILLEQKRMMLEQARQQTHIPPTAEQPMPTPAQLATAETPKLLGLASLQSPAREEAAQNKILELLEHPNVSITDKNLLAGALQAYLNGLTILDKHAQALDEQLLSMTPEASWRLPSPESAAVTVSPEARQAQEEGEFTEPPRPLGLASLPSPERERAVQNKILELLNNPAVSKTEKNILERVLKKCQKGAKIRDEHAQELDELLLSMTPAASWRLPSPESAAVTVSPEARQAQEEGEFTEPPRPLGLASLPSPERERAVQNKILELLDNPAVSNKELLIDSLNSFLDGYQLKDEDADNFDRYLLSLTPGAAHIPTSPAASRTPTPPAPIDDMTGRPDEWKMWDEDGEGPSKPVIIQARQLEDEARQRSLEARRAQKEFELAATPAPAEDEFELQDMSEQDLIKAIIPTPQSALQTLDLRNKRQRFESVDDYLQYLNSALQLVQLSSDSENWCTDILRYHLNYANERYDNMREKITEELNSPNRLFDDAHNYIIDDLKYLEMLAEDIAILKEIVEICTELGVIRWL